MGGQIPGIGGGGVGGGPPGVPGQPQPQTATDPNQKAQQILATLLQAAQRKQAANTAVPGQVPGQTDPRIAQSIGMNTANPHAWGTQRFLAGLAGNIKNAVAKQKQDQLLKAEGDWTYLQSALNEKFTAEQSGDQKAVQAAEAKLQAVLGDPKKLKNMAKALNQDWLNPEKTTVYGEALKKVTANQKQQDQQNQQKQGAAQKLKSTVMGLLKQKQQLQLSLDEQKRMAQEIEAKAPTTTAGIDKESAAALREQMREEARAAEETRRENARAAEEDKKEAARLKEQETKAKNDQVVLETREKYQTERDRMNNASRDALEGMRERAAEQRQHERDVTMLAGIDKRISAQYDKEARKPPSQLNKEVTDSVGTLKAQLAQFRQASKSLETQAHNKWFGTTFSPELQKDIDEAKSNADDLEKAIAHIEKNRDAIINGKADLGDVVNKAYDIMGGGSGGTDDVPGFKPDKK
jgi:hypothetical protein